MSHIHIYHPGTQHVKKLCSALLKHNYELKLFTGLIIGGHPRIPKKFANRNSTLPKKIIYNNYVLEFLYHFLKRVVNANRAISIRNYLFQIKYAVLHKPVSKAIVIGFDTSSYILFNLKNQYNILDQTSPESGFCNVISEKIKKKYPLYSFGLKTKSIKELHREKQEHHLADIIVTASTFSKNTLIESGVDEKKIVCIPYGVDLTFYNTHHKRDYSDKLIYLYVGQVSVNKGVPNLLECWESLNLENAELWIVGDIFDKMLWTNISQIRNVRYFGKVVHIELKKIYANAHIFVFPTFFDGFGLVLLEAMASGLAIVSSINSAAPDLISANEEGFLFDPWKNEELKNYLLLLHKDRSLTKRMGEKCQLKAQNYLWDSYSIKWNQLINKVEC